MRPLLLDGFKVDLRLYAVATGWDPPRVYVHAHGYCRVAQTPFKPYREGDELSAHVTNADAPKPKDGNGNGAEPRRPSQARLTIDGLRALLAAQPGAHVIV